MFSTGKLQAHIGMDSGVEEVFAQLFNHVRSVISCAFDNDPAEWELIYRKTCALADELQSFARRHQERGIQKGSRHLSPPELVPSFQCRTEPTISNILNDDPCEIPPDNAQSVQIDASTMVFPDSASDHESWAMGNDRPVQGTNPISTLSDHHSNEDGTVQSNEESTSDASSGVRDLCSEGNASHGSHNRDDAVLSDLQECVVPPVCPKPHILNEMISLPDIFTQEGREEMDSAAMQKSVNSNDNNGIGHRHEEVEFAQVVEEEDILQNSQPEQQEPAEPVEPEQPVDQEIRPRTRVAHQRRVNAVVASSSSSASRRTKRKSQGDEVTTPVSSMRKKPHLETPKRETAQPPKTRKAQASTEISDAPSKLFEELAHVPARVIQPETVYSIFAQRSAEKYHDHLPLLTRLFFAIASPDAFDQLSEACTITRQKNGPKIPDSLNDVLQTMHALDTLDAATSLTSILRRFQLARLLDHRIGREYHHKTQRQLRPIRRYKYSQEKLDMVTGVVTEPDRPNQPERRGRANTKALIDLMADFYPRLQRPEKSTSAATDAEYWEKHKKLKNRLGCARPWYLLQQQFSPGILALVPSGDGHVPNDRIERIPNPLFTTFLDVLYEQRGDFLVKVSHSISEHIRDILHGKEVGMKYTFENMDKMALKQEPLDSPEFVRFCEIE